MSAIPINAYKTAINNPNTNNTLSLAFTSIIITLI